MAGDEAGMSETEKRLAARVRELEKTVAKLNPAAAQKQRFVPKITLGRLAVLGGVLVAATTMMFEAAPLITQYGGGNAFPVATPPASEATAPPPSNVAPATAFAFPSCAVGYFPSATVFYESGLLPIVLTKKGHAVPGPDGKACALTSALGHCPVGYVPPQQWLADSGLPPSAFKPGFPVPGPDGNACAFNPKP
jgi:hypothetical protein